MGRTLPEQRRDLERGLSGAQPTPLDGYHALPESPPNPKTVRGGGCAGAMLQRAVAAVPHQFLCKHLPFLCTDRPKQRYVLMCAT